MEGHHGTASAEMGLVFTDRRGSLAVGGWLCDVGVAGRPGMLAVLLWGAVYGGVLLMAQQASRPKRRWPPSRLDDEFWFWAVVGALSWWVIR